MPRKRTNKKKSKRFSSLLPGLRSRRKRKSPFSPALIGILNIFVLVVFAAGSGTGFFCLKKYVAHNIAVWNKAGTLNLINVPGWVNENLENRIYAAAVSGGENLHLDEDAAASVYHNLKSQVPWLDELRVRTTSRSISVAGKWRMPIALVKAGLKKCYVDGELVVLDYVPIQNLPIVRIEGLSGLTSLPTPGQTWHREDLAAAVAVLIRLNRMDQLVSPDKPLLAQIDRIDMSNFNGRENSKHPHVILYAKDNTEIIWGAEIGTWQRHLECSDEQKLNMFYSHYQQNGNTLLGNVVQFINLSEPRDGLFLPIDKTY